MNNDEGDQPMTTLYTHLLPVFDSLFSAMDKILETFAIQCGTNTKQTVEFLTQFGKTEYFPFITVWM